jgi:chromosome segregation ATPase
VTTKVSGPPLPASGRKQQEQLVSALLQQGARVDAACILRDKQLERSASVTRQQSKTIKDLQDYRATNELTQSKLKQVNAESKIANENLQKRSNALEHKLQQLQKSIIGKTAEVARLTEDCTVHVSARQELGDQLRDRAQRIRTLEGETKALTEFAYAEQSKAYKAGTEANEAEGYRAAACAELQDVKQHLVRARCGEDDYRCRAKRLATENEVLSNIVERAISR